MATDAATHFHAWFNQSFHCPTPAQRLAWPIIERGENLLLCAPTGTGKTIAAFLPILDELAKDPIDGLACLYVAPLKALTRDVTKNLRRAANAAQLQCGIRIDVRTGDTPAATRRRQLLEPPHLLLTTPESLAILLTHANAHAVFASLRWIVVDEIHSLMSNKRGADLCLSLERVSALAKTPVQRIGLSATCTPLDKVAQFLVGVGRPCAIAHVPDASAMTVAIEPLTDDKSDVGFMARLVHRLETELTANRTTLVFTNARGMAERLTWALKRRFPERAERIAVHHSSVSVQGRRLVERQLKKGQLVVVVTSTSLELGIDIGSVDGVVLVHPPGGVARLLQRLGRSGHRPGAPRRGLILTSGVSELLEATVTAAAGRDGQLETLAPIAKPLDVLCQHLVGMAMTGAWTGDEAFRLVRGAYPYEALQRDEFNACLDYLSGRRADGRPWLPPRLRWHGERFTIVSTPTAKLLRRNLGTILSDVRCTVRLLEGNEPWSPFAPRKDALSRSETRPFAIGSVDEAYADRLRPGDRLLLGGRCLEYRRREKDAVLVDEASVRPVVPRWTGSVCPLTRELAAHLFHFRARAAEALRDGLDALRHYFATEYGLAASASAELANHLLLQETVSEIPDACMLLVEAVADDLGLTYYVHTPLHRAANDGLARVAAQRFQRRYDREAVTMSANLGFIFAAPEEMNIDTSAWRELLADKDFDDDLAEAVRASDSLRQRFAAVATTGLMVLRNPLGGRRKVGGQDWSERRLYDQVRQSEPDFVLVRQAEREVMTNVCDAPAAREFAARMPMRRVSCRQLQQVSPFAASWSPGLDAGTESATGPAEALARLQAALMSA